MGQAKPALNGEARFGALPFALSEEGYHAGPAVWSYCGTLGVRAVTVVQCGCRQCPDGLMMHESRIMDHVTSWAPSRRLFLTSATAFVLLGTATARARILTGGMPWEPGTATPPAPVRPGPWMFFTSDEASLIEAAVDRLIPADERGPGGKDTGCAVF